MASRKKIVKNSEIISAQGIKEMANETTNETGPGIMDVAASRRLPSVSMAGPSIASYRIPATVDRRPAGKPGISPPGRPAAGNLEDIAELTVGIIQSTLTGANKLVAALSGSPMHHGDYHSMHCGCMEHYPYYDEDFHHCHGEHCEHCYIHSRCGGVYGC